MKLPVSYYHNVQCDTAHVMFLYYSYCTITQVGTARTGLSRVHQVSARA